MIHERATVLAVQESTVLLEARQQSACDSCRAQSGCGQAVLSRLMNREAAVPALLPPTMSGLVSPGDIVTVAIPAQAVVLGSVMLYLVPVMSLLAGVLAASAMSASEWVAAFAGLLGLTAGGAVVRMVSWRLRQHPGWQPSVVPTPVGEGLSSAGRLCRTSLPTGS